MKNNNNYDIKLIPFFFFLVMKVPKLFSLLIKYSSTKLIN